jgi:hypothetical protein
MARVDIVQKAWEIAKGPIKQLPMNIFMMWMAGNTVHIFSLMMVFMMVMNPIKALSNVSAGMRCDAMRLDVPLLCPRHAMGGACAAFGTLASDADIDITYQKAAYVALNIAALGLPAYKANSMGLWPSTADFLYGEPFDPVCTVCCPGPRW